MKTLVGALGIVVVLLVLSWWFITTSDPMNQEATTGGYNVVKYLADHQPELRPMIVEAMADGKLINREMMAIIQASDRLSMVACLGEEGE